MIKVSKEKDILVMFIFVGHHTKVRGMDLPVLFLLVSGSITLLMFFTSRTDKPPLYHVVSSFQNKIYSLQYLVNPD